MSRKTLMTIHLYLAAFFAPIMLLFAVSGGLYLTGVKGSVEKGESIFLPSVAIDADAEKESQVQSILEQAGLDADFEYVKDRGRLLQTRPTSRDYYELEPTPQGVKITPVSPDLIASLMELHKGHGPGLFRILEQVTALGLILILISGLIIGLKSPLLKKPTIGLTAAGILVFVVLAAVL
ncbi:MAG: PepSY-associated TM helix domain-containing protein [Pseudomonadota bacterium]|nr:PepSY-associated TM helix domain-containing protein [Pseudomonadota bacterium]